MPLFSSPPAGETLQSFEVKRFDLELRMVNLRALCQQWPPPEVALCSWGIPEGKFPGWPSSAPGGGGAGDDLDLESLNEDAKILE